MTNPEEALKDARNHSSLLGDYNGATKRIKTNSSGKLSVNLDTAQETSGSEDYIFVNDTNVGQVLIEILEEMKIMNLHLSVMTDNTFNRTDTEA